MSLTQFGSILSFAILLEEKLEELYKELASKENGALSEEFSKRAKACVKRKQRLERSRRENITEITLEPIEGLDEKKYQLNLSGTSPQEIDTLEKQVITFYFDVTPKINVLETRRVLKRCQKEHSNLKNLSEEK
ncbi:hypothetical protein CEE45_03645 [Candidatus Heimdallarchaeota archaeon B3_Heim]|nr:MAG: hypothetical protein CEE45_03645 [Candidatus Heimdallarchaeota archaeon B3_Heim]